jgi:hypothetical protein
MSLVALALALIHRRRARAERDFDPAAPLRDGPAVVSGVVEAEGGEPPLIVRIEQIGTEQSTKNGTHHTWTETSRAVIARPFLVRREDGTRVRVEPDERVLLHGSLARTERRAVNLRTRIATVAAGEEVHVHGELLGAGRGQGGGAYRGASTLPTMRASRLAPMMISSEPPGGGEAEQMRFHAWSAALLAAGFLLFSAIVVPTYQLLAFTGAVVDARPTETRAWKVWVKPKSSPGYWVWKHALRAEIAAPGGGATGVEDQCSEEVYNAASRGLRPTVPFLVSRLDPTFHQIGTAPKLDGIRPWIVALLGLVLGLVYPFAAAENRPWYARRRVVETGSGTLASTMPGPC